jgi:hypothetical protein
MLSPLTDTVVGLRKKEVSMTVITLADPVSGIGILAGINQFADINGDNIDAKDRYVLHPVDPIARMFGVSSERIDAAALSFGIQPERVFYEIIRLTPEVYEASKAEEALSVSAADDAEEIWVADFGERNDPEGVSLENVAFVRVA